MAGWGEVCEIAAALPSAEAGKTFGNAAWKLRGKPVVWERPLRARDLAELGDAAPTGPVIGVRVADEGEKLALIAEDPAVFFTTSHFDGHPSILVALERIDAARLVELVLSAWAARGGVS
ncbi:MAG TPA: MmcQ/YjbR family DNA-binding protein [Microbacteriaceae bacterium]|nr:MmcQ/YjbR family DNA-binding protein [Microbacteriaceae bacterium]